MEPTRKALEKPAKRVTGGKVKAPERIGAAAARILSRHHGQHYFGWKLEQGTFHYFEHHNLERGKAYEVTPCASPA